MATTINDVRRKTGGPQAAPPRPRVGGDERLPLGTCGGCEQSLFASFRGAARTDEQVWKSPDRRREERLSEKERPSRIRCRHCGRVEDRTPVRGGRITRIP